MEKRCQVHSSQEREKGSKNTNNEQTNGLFWNCLYKNWLKSNLNFQIICSLKNLQYIKSKCLAILIIMLILSVKRPLCPLSQTTIRYTPLILHCSATFHRSQILAPSPLLDLSTFTPLPVTTQPPPSPPRTPPMRNLPPPCSTPGLRSRYKKVLANRVRNWQSEDFGKWCLVVPWWFLKIFFWGQ